MKKLKFVNFGISLFGNSFRMNPNFYLLKSYYKFKSHNFNKIIWTAPSFSQKTSVEQVLNEIDQKSIDILCISVFAWNFERSIMLAKKAKKTFPYIKIIAGGPHLSAHKDDTFFDSYPYFDYIVYGDGEEAFCEIVDSIVESRKIKDEAVNIITKEKKYPFRIFKDEHYKNVSAVLQCKEDIKRDVQILKNEGIEHIVFNWEKARGCPYKCSFCDWSSGLHNKVVRFESDWKKELDFLFSLNLIVVPTDANWGIYKEDIEITKYGVSKGRFRVVNLTKLQKDRSFEIAEIMFSSKYSLPNMPKGMLKLSFQDINEDVLENINRPDVTWTQQKQLILNFYNKFPKTHIVGEFIIGLPGQTKENLIKNFFELEEAMIKTVVFWFWEILPNSPAYEQNYQKKFNIKTKKIFMINDGVEFDNTESFYNSVEKGEPGWSSTTFVCENFSIDFKSIILIKLLAQIYNGIKAKNKNTQIKPFFDKIIKALNTEVISITKEIEKTGILAVRDFKTKKLISIENVFNNNRLDYFLEKHQIDIKD
jgi:hypothetical protein